MQSIFIHLTLNCLRKKKNVPLLVMSQCLCCPVTASCHHVPDVAPCPVTASVLSWWLLSLHWVLPTHRPSTSTPLFTHTTLLHTATYPWYTHTHTPSNPPSSRQRPPVSYCPTHPSYISPLPQPDSSPWHIPRPPTRYTCPSQGVGGSHGWVGLRPVSYNMVSGGITL